MFFASSFLGAAMNSVAGGGTFLTFPVFIMAGLTPSQANVMSTIALWPGVLSSAYGYRAQFGACAAELKGLGIVGFFGGIMGALWFLSTPEATFSVLVPWLLLFATIIFTHGRRITAILKGLHAPVWLKRTLAVVFQVMVGLYGGYFGAGIGILTLALLELQGHTDIHRMNALKTLLTASINLATVGVFIVMGDVIWLYALVMITGALCGGYVGARTALRVPQVQVRRGVSLIGFAMAAYFFLH